NWCFVTDPYPFCAGSGADTELTGRHPAP
ncbi:hypothetical protein, partial [Escherichia coli]